MPNAYEDTNTEQEKLFVILPKITSLGSLLCSAYLAYDVVRLYRKNNKLFTTYHTMLLGLSVSDMIFSLATFLTSWPAPEGTLPFAAGNEATCAMQGFLIQLGVATMIYNGFLSLYFMLVICHGWSDHKLKQYKIRYLSHFFAIAFALSTAIAALALDAYNPEEGFCWIASGEVLCIPQDFNVTDDSLLNHFEEENAKPCEFDDDLVTVHHYGHYYEHDGKFMYRWPFFYIPVFLIILVSVTAMIRVFVAYIRQAQASRKWTGKGNTAEIKRTRLFTTQALLYIASFCLPFAVIMFWSLQVAIGDGTNWYVFMLLSAVTIPSQGIFNLLVYIRPRLIQRREKRRLLKEKEAKGIANRTTATTGETGDPNSSHAEDVDDNTEDSAQGNEPQEVNATFADQDFGGDGDSHDTENQTSERPDISALSTHDVQDHPSCQLFDDDEDPDIDPAVWAELKNESSQELPLPPSRPSMERQPSLGLRAFYERSKRTLQILSRRSDLMEGSDPKDYDFDGAPHNIT